MRKLTAILSLLLSVCVPSFAWGPQGHRVIAELAERHLNNAARRHIHELLGNDDLASVSTWADEIREQRPETSGWHFVNIPWDALGFSEVRDCFHPDPRNPATLTDHHNCAVDRITVFERILADRHASRADRTEALKFVVHFVADLHQPLHAVAEARGGNDISISALGTRRCGHRPCNLHMLWDIGMIEHAHHSDLEYTVEIEGLMARKNLQSQSAGTPAQWANESFRLAHSVWLRDGEGADQDYYRRNRHILDRQLALAGLRLGRLLNSALGN